jgi:hypothetical protein
MADATKPPAQPGMARPSDSALRDEDCDAAPSEQEIRSDQICFEAFSQLLQV